MHRNASLEQFHTERVGLISIRSIRINGERMDDEYFRESAKLIVKRNVSERISRVLLNLNQNSTNLRLVYCTIGIPNSDDIEDCELSCGEIVGAFPEIRSAETICVEITDCEEFLNFQTVFQI